MSERYSLKASFEAVREVDFGSIGANYTSLGSALLHPARLISITNSTNVEVYISFDGTNNHIRLAANSFKLFDISSNKSSYGMFFRQGTQFYLKQVSNAPTSGSVWIEAVFAN